MNVNKTELPATKGFAIVHCRLWNIVHGSNLKWNRCIPHRFTSSRDCLQYVSPSLKHLMRKTDRLHARKDPRYNFFVGKLLPLKHPRKNPDNNISSVTNMLEDLGCRTVEQRRIDSRLTASLGGSSLLTLTGSCALSCAGHVACTRKVSSRFILACPQSIYPFSQEQLLSGTICLVLSLANTDTY